MEREILFRGKTKYGSWIIGDLLQYANTAQIWTQEEHGKCNYIVDPATVGQFTGLCDKNGVKIFEGDVIRCIANPEVNQFISSGTIEVMQCDYVVVYKEKSACGFYYLHHVLMDTVEVIGNIHDTPDLVLKEEAE